jgi:hypothetical protein
MIEPIMYIVIGFLAASLLALVTIPLVHDRAVRLTLRRVEAEIPVSVAEIQAHKDQLRAAFAVTTCQLETSVEQLKAKTASQLAELGKKTDTIAHLKIDLGEKAAAIFALERSNKVLKAQLNTAEEAALNGRHADHLLANTLARVTADSNARSILADSQRIEIVALKTEIETLKNRLSLAHNPHIRTS